jgi:hypothetical protein
MNENEGKEFKAKLRFDLLPVHPLERVAYAFTVGAGKRQERDWEKGRPWSDEFAALQRHAWKWWGGERLDPEDGQHHLAAVVARAMILMDLEDGHPECDDRRPPLTDNTAGV